MKYLYEAFITLLIIISIVLIISDSITELDPTTRNLVYTTDFLICIVLALDYVYKLLRSSNKSVFLRKYWYEILALIPAYLFLSIEAQLIGAVLRSLRTIRVIRIARLLRLAPITARTIKLCSTITRIFVESKVVYLLLLTVTITVLSGIAVYTIEKDLADTTIKTVYDALWWSLTTITTVGYGDKVPVTPEGKTIGIILMIIGVITWSATTTLLTTTIIERKHEETSLEQELRKIAKKYMDQIDKLTPRERELLRKIIELTIK